MDNIACYIVNFLINVKTITIIVGIIDLRTIKFLIVVIVIIGLVLGTLFTKV